MNNFPADSVARTMMDLNIREANQHRLAREAKRAQRPAKAEPKPTVREARRHSRLWTVVHFRHSYS